MPLNCPLIIHTIWRIDSKVDGNIRDAFIFASHSIGFIFNLLAHGIKVRKHTTLAVQKFSIFYN